MRRLATAWMVPLVSWLGLVAPAAGDTFKPTRFDDPQAAKCTPSNCSLRGAVNRANRNGGTDEIVLASGTYDIELPETAQNDNAGGDFDVKGGVRILGKGVSKTTVDANDLSRAFSLLGDQPKRIEKMAITDGTADLGGAIFVAPPKTALSPGVHTLRNLLIQGNDASLRGGGIYGTSHRLKVSRTTLESNGAIGGGGMYLGAAAIQGDSSPPVKIRSSTFSGNTADLGGGLYVDGANEGDANLDPNVDVLNSTFANNVARVSGGGIATILGASFHGEHVTVAYNASDADSSGGGNGGGIYQSASASFEIQNSLVKENLVGSTGGGPQCAGEFRFSGVITPQTPGPCVFLGGSISQGEGPPEIGILLGNGGPTHTIAITPGSAANGWNEVLCPPKDQRGTPRPQPNCDAGAYERVGGTP